jgi:hypothetical protein
MEVAGVSPPLVPLSFAADFVPGHPPSLLTASPAAGGCNVVLGASAPLTASPSSAHFVGLPPPLMASSSPVSVKTIFAAVSPSSIAVEIPQDSDGLSFSISMLPSGYALSLSAPMADMSTAGPVAFKPVVSTAPALCWEDQPVVHIPRSPATVDPIIPKVSDTSSSHHWLGLGPSRDLPFPVPSSRCDAERDALISNEAWTLPPTPYGLAAPEADETSSPDYSPPSSPPYSPSSPSYRPPSSQPYITRYADDLFIRSRGYDPIPVVDVETFVPVANFASMLANAAAPF